MKTRFLATKDGMKAIMVMFDSLNRHFLPPYGCSWTHAPNFSRLAQRSVTFDNSYICSMPCMPARRDLHTGRPNFLHRSWGQLEPFDDSVPEMLRKAGIFTHLSTDHYHYWEDGGATYHNRYSSFDFARGQEGDPCYGQVTNLAQIDAIGRHGNLADYYPRQDWINRTLIESEVDMPQAKTFAAGLDFMRRNASADNWFLQIETFDPHEPFNSDPKYKQHYPHEYDGPHFDWPVYGAVQESPDQVEHIRYEYASLLSMCDAYLGKILDMMDELNLWEDTMLIVWTDHGFMLGEHGLWAKCWNHVFYQEIAHTPFWVWDPRSAKAGERRQSLVQPAIDLGPTLLEFFGLESTADMLGKSLRQTILDDAPVRETGVFGMFGGYVGVTDGKHVYLRTPVEGRPPLYQYTHNAAQMRGFLALEDLAEMEISEPFSFTKGCRVMKVPCSRAAWAGNLRHESMLYDVKADPAQTQAIEDPKVERYFVERLNAHLQECDAPREQWVRLGLK